MGFERESVRSEASTKPFSLEEWNQKLIDPRIPLTLRIWIRSLKPESLQNINSWPKYIKDAAKESLNIDLGKTQKPEDIGAQLVSALREADERYVSSRYTVQNPTAPASVKEVPSETTVSEGDAETGLSEKEAFTEAIASATTPEEFFDALREIASVPSSRGTLSAEHIIELFKNQVSGPLEKKILLSHLVPQTYGVRDAFERLATQPRVVSSFVPSEQLPQDSIKMPNPTPEDSENVRVTELPTPREQVAEVSESPIEETSELQQLRSEYEELKSAVLGTGLNRKDRSRLEAMIPRYEARIAQLALVSDVSSPESVIDAVSGPEVLTMTPRVSSEKESVPPKFEKEIRTDAESQPEAAKNEIAPDVARVFEKNFNIKKEDLSSIDGFERLSAAQQKFIAENLSQLALGNVHDDAARTVSESVGMRKSEMVQNYGRFLGGVLAGVQEVFTKKYATFKSEQEVATQMEAGGMAVHGKLLSELVTNIASYGPRIHENAKGELIVDLVNIRERATDKATRDAEWFAMNELNTVAHEFAKTPAEWKGETLGIEESGVMRFFKEKVLRTAGRVQESTYEKRTVAYENAKRYLEDVLRKKGYNDLKIAETLIGIDTRVFQLQTLRTNPNAMEELAAIKDKNFFVASAQQFFKGPGAYMALGAMGRTLGGAAIGFFGAPLAAAGIASIRSWNRTAAELRERDRNARAGVVDTKAGALNVVAAERAEQIVLVNGQEMHNGLTAKLKRLTERAMAAEGAEKTKLLAQLQSRVQYVYDKQKLQRIDFGQVEGRVSRQVALAKSLGDALAYLSEEESATAVAVTERTSQTNTRLAAKLDRVQMAILEARKKGRRSDLVRSAATGTGFSLAGAILADYFKGSESTIFRRTFETATAARSIENLENVQSTVSTQETSEFVSESGKEVVSEKALATDGVASSITEAPAAPEAFKPYTIQKGDTLIGIMRAQIPAIQELSEQVQARENATMNILRDLSARELQEIGITSGNVNVIYAGDSINLEKLNAAIEARQSLITRAVERFGNVSLEDEPMESVATPVDTESWTSSEAIENRKIRLLERAQSFFASPDAWDQVRTLPMSRVLRAEGGYPVDEPELNPVINFFKSIDIDSVKMMLPPPAGYIIEQHLNLVADSLAHKLTPEQYESFIAENTQRVGEPVGVPTTPEVVNAPIDDTEVEITPATIEEPAQVEQLPAETQVEVMHESVDARKEKFETALREQYSSERDWNRITRLRMKDVLAYEGVVTSNTESLAWRAQSVFALRASLEAAGISTPPFPTSGTVGEYFDVLINELAENEQASASEKITKALNLDTAREVLTAQWSTPSAIEARSKTLTDMVSQSFRALDRSQWAEWGQSASSPFDNKSEFALELRRQQSITDYEEIQNLLRQHGISSETPGESETQRIQRLSKALAQKITPEEFTKLKQ